MCEFANRISFGCQLICTKKQAGNQKVVGLNNVTGCIKVSLTTGALRSFDRVDLDFFDLDFNLAVRGKVAEASGPLFNWCRCFGANRADATFYDVITTFTHFDNVLTAAAFGDATFFTPESTFCTGKNCLTLHGGTPLFELDLAACRTIHELAAFSLQP